MSCQDLKECRNFLEEITSNSDEDSWYIKVGSYYLEDFEILGEVTNWTLQFLAERKCPAALTAPITRNVVESVQNECRKSPTTCGLDATKGNYDPSRLKQMVVTSLKNFCQRLLDNVELNKILPSQTEQPDYPKYVVSSLRNRRRNMEDRHICVDDFNGTYNIQNAQKASFYAVFDGHSGHNAAVYSASQLPYFVAKDSSYPQNPGEALRKAFLATDAAFLEKCKQQAINGGTTAVCALHFPEQGRLYVAWVGDSKALLVKKGRFLQIVKPHKPDCPIEGERIRKQGGTIMHWGGTVRVNGLLNLSRAIGDSNCKPYVISDPDIVCLELDKEEDFLVVACDGLWDYVKDEDVAHTVYKQLQDCENLNEVPQSLIEISKLNGSADNITVVVVFLKHPCLIVKNSSPLEAMETTFDNCNNADLNNPVQNLLQNANIEFKTEKANEIFKTDNPFNDGLNNFVQIGDTNNMLTKLDSSGDNQQEDLPECEQIYHYGDEILHTKNIDKQPFDGDLGPETSVDVPDDANMATESSEENLSKSSLSHSKDIFPLSDNFNPFDVKNSLTDLETNEFQTQDDTKTCTTPSENLFDTPIDPSPLDDIKQELPADCVHTNGVHSEEDHFAEDLIHGQIQMSNECLKDNKNETSDINELLKESKTEDDFFKNLIEDNKKVELNDDKQKNFPGFGVEPFEPDLVENIIREEKHIIELLDDNQTAEQGIAFAEESIKHFEEEINMKSPADPNFEGNILELHASGDMLKAFEQELCGQEAQEIDVPLESGHKKEDLNESNRTRNIDFELDQRQFDERNSSDVHFEEENVPSIELNSADSMQEVDEQTHPIEEVIQQELILQTQEEHVPENHSQKISNIHEDIPDLLDEVVLQKDQEAIPLVQDEQISLAEIEKLSENDCKAEQESVAELPEKNMLIKEMDDDNHEAPVEEEVQTRVEATFDEKIPDLDTLELKIKNVETEKEAPSTQQVYQPTAPESCEESEDEWNYMQLKGEGEKEIPKDLEAGELASPIKSESIPEELHSPVHHLKEAESQEATITSVEESKGSITTSSVEPSADTLQISESQLDISDQEVADMASQLNPEAKEFIPTNPSPVHFELSNGIPPIPAARHISGDDVVAQSPRKGIFSMDDIQIPSETEFENDIAHCPSEMQITPEPDEPYQEMNLKEAMHGSEKEEQVCDEGYDYNMPTDLDNVGMKDSIYIENRLDKQEDFMNTVQPLPSESDEIKDTSMEIPTVPDTSLNEISVDNTIVTDSSLKLDVVNEVSPPAIENVLEHIIKSVDILELSEPTDQTVVEPTVVKQEVNQVEAAPVLEFEQVEMEISSQSPVHPADLLNTGSDQPAVPVLNEPVLGEVVLLPTMAMSPVNKQDQESKIEKVETKPIVKVPEAKKDVKARVSSAAAPKKVGSATSASSSDASKPKTTTAPKPKTTTSTTPRPRTVPLTSKPIAEKKTPSNVAAARPKVDARSTASLTASKKPATATTKTKPDEQIKTGVKQSVSKTGVTTKPPATTRTSSTTSTASKPRTTAPTTNVTATKTASQRVALSATAKSATTTKSVTSPRGTLTSTLRKTEALKSPTGTTKVTLTKTTTATLSAPRTTSATKPKPTTPTTKTSTTTTNAKKLPSPRLTQVQKKAPVKKTSISPIKKIVTDENKKNQELNEVKLNGTVIESAIKVESSQ